MKARYIDNILKQWSRRSGRPPATEAFLHLGHWEDPRGAVERSDFLAAQRRLAEVLLEMADVRDGQRVLDVGCGVGAMLAMLAKRHPGARLVGLNNDPRQLALARELAGGGGRVSWVEADACRMPLEDGSFERALAVECAFHFPSRARFLAEAARVLAPGGLLVTSDFVPTTSGRRLGAEREREIAARLEELGPFPDVLWREGEPAELAKAAGLKLRKRGDATAHAAASLRCLIAPREGDPEALSGSMQELAKLLDEDVLRMEYHLYERP